jgi:phytoene desaturase
VTTEQEAPPRRRGGRKAAHVVVVGAGLGGLSAACHLAGRGYRVTVLERSGSVGGRARAATREGWHLDLGPTVLTMAPILESTFRAAGARMEDHLRLRRLDPLYRATFADGRSPTGGGTIRVRAGRDAMADEIRAVSGSRDAKAFHRFADWLEQLARLEVPAFIDRNWRSPLDLARPLGPAMELVRLGGFRRLDAQVRRFFSDERLVRLFSFQALYAGVAPTEALAVFAVITYMDTIAGVWFPDGGMSALPEALASAASLAGAKIVLGAEVTEVRRRGRSPARVEGVRLSDGSELDADAVVVNAEVTVAYRELLGGLRPLWRARRARPSPSCVLWVAGVPDATLEHEVAHHNVHFGEAWRGAFADLIDRRRRMRDPSLLVSVPTLTDATLAPPGGHVLYVLEPAPGLDGSVPWGTERGRARDQLIRRAEALGYPTAAKVEELLDPFDWARAGMEQGTPFATAHTFLQSGPFRAPNVDKRLPGLVFVGSSTVPGVGVPMVLLSGRLAAERVDEMLGDDR